MLTGIKHLKLFTCVIILLGIGRSSASDEGDEFFRMLKTSRKDALLIRLTEAALSEEICKGIESLPNEEQLLKDLGGTTTIYVLDRTGKDPVTRDLEARYFFDNIPLGIFIDGDGRPVGKTIVTSDKKDNLIREIKRLQTLKETRDKAFAESTKSEKGHAVELLDQALSILPKNELDRYYHKEIQQVLEGGDPELVKKYQTILSTEKDRSVVEAALERLRQKINGGNIDLAAIIAHLDEEKSKDGLNNEIKQKLEMHKFRYFSGARAYDKALASLDVAFALAPMSELAAKIEGFRTRTQKAKTQQVQEKQTEESVPQPPSN